MVSFQIKAIVFVIASAGMAWISRASMRNLKSHGFYRFFAWEAILVMILLNLNYWFCAPFSFHQIVSWLLLIASLFLVIHAALLLHSMGKPDKRRNDSTLIGIEKTTELVTGGAYRYIRHPIYSSLLFLAWGVFCKHPSWVGVGLAVIATFSLAMTAKKEEAENLHFFGAAYRSYMERTKMFIPFIF